MTSVISAWQGSDGAFHTLPPIRVPIESNDVTATALSIRALQLYGTDPDSRVVRARHWLRSAAVRSTEERAMQLLGLTWANAPADDIRMSASALLAMQHDDGGWAQLPNLETDAYATGQALVALQVSGYPVSSAEYERGKAFLLRTQFQDGSWLVRTRTFPVQPPKDTGFPLGKHVSIGLDVLWSRSSASGDRPRTSLISSTAGLQVQIFCYSGRASPNWSNQIG